MEFLPDAREQLRQNTTSNAVAYEAYLKGRYLWYEETESSLRQAITEFQSAIKLDPNYAPAYVGLADAYNVLGGYGFVPVGDALPKGKAAAAKALELGPNLSDAYASMAFVAFYYDWNWPESEELFRKTLSLNPNNAVGHEFYSSYLHAMGRLDDAEKESRIAQELDPLSGWVRDDMGWILLSRRRPEAAVAEFRKAIELNPKFPAAHLSLAVAYSRLGKYSDALQEVQKAEELGGSPTRVLEVRGSVQAMSGDSVGAQKTLGQLMSGTVKGRISPYSIALIYTAMGRKSEALDWLEKAYNEKDTWIVWTKVLVEWDSLRSEPRFQVLQKKLNF
jgi:tetratricopeptide (TPR) repeat protein